MAAAELSESFDLEITGVGKLLQMFAEYRVGNVQSITEVRELCPLHRRKAGADAQPNRCMDQLVEACRVSLLVHSHP